MSPQVPQHLARCFLGEVLVLLPRKVLIKLFFDSSLATRIFLSNRAIFGKIVLNFNAFGYLTPFKGKIKSKMIEIEYFGCHQTQFDGLLTQISLVMHKNDT